MSIKGDRCALCDKSGAKWIVGNDSFRKLVHKDCGKTIAKSAPRGSFSEGLSFREASHGVAGKALLG